MLSSISIRKTATYSNVGVEINDLKKINFIYGSNGSGKTTISKLIDSPNDLSKINLKWVNNNPVNTLVYNKDFRERNFAGDSIDGVFTLGEATKDDIKIIEDKTKELNKLTEEGNNKKNTLKTQEQTKNDEEKAFTESVWTEIYKKHENEFKEAFNGFLAKKITFKDELLAIHNKQNQSVLTYKELKLKAKTIFGETPVKMEMIQNINSTELLAIGKNPIWQKKILGKPDIDIADLISKLNMNDWVNQGRNYLQNDICPFCQQETITEDFKNKLEQYFDKTFLDDTEIVKNQSEKYNKAFETLIEILINIESHQKNINNSKLNIELFAANLKILSNQQIYNKDILNKKIKEPSISIELTDVSEQINIIINLINASNAEITKHNNIVNDLKNEKTNLVSEIWKYLAEENKAKIETFSKKRNGLQKGINNLTNKITELRNKYVNLKNELIELNRNVTSVQPTIDEINRTLTSFGFENFKIVASKDDQNKYQIQRKNGHPLEEQSTLSTLSEGEITFITFLYFLQLAKGGSTEETVSSNRILVIDDPVSSLDSNILFLVSSLLKDIINEIKEGNGNIKQLILLTHNVYFHKEVSFINSRITECKDTNFWILRKNKDITSIEPFKMKNPIKNSYELLWQELKVENQSSVTIQNTMRKIIENYFKILGGLGDDDITNKFDSSEEQIICKSLLCWINDGSHCVSDDLYIEEPNPTIERYKEVFKNIFINTGHQKHYEMMSRITSVQ